MALVFSSLVFLSLSFLLFFLLSFFPSNCLSGVCQGEGVVLGVDLGESDFALPGETLDDVPREGDSRAGEIGDLLSLFLTLESYVAPELLGKLLDLG